MTADLDLSFTAQLGALTAGINGMCDRMDRVYKLRQRAAEGFRQVPIIINVPLVAGAANLNPTTVGPDIGFYWSVRKMAAVGYSAGSVSVYIDNTSGEPLAAFPTAFPTVTTQTWGKGHMLIHPNSSIGVVATGITGTVQIWGTADQFEHWMLPWYMGAWRDDQ